MCLFTKLNMSFHSDTIFWFRTNQSLQGPSCPWSYGSWIYNYICNRCLSPLIWVGLPLRAKSTTCDKICQWLAAGRWFSPGFLDSSTNKTGCHDITEILLKVVLNTIKPNQSLLLFLNAACLAEKQEIPIL